MPVQVTDSNGRPLPHIKIHFSDNNYGSSGVVQTDSNGKTVVCAFKPQRLTINVEAQDFYVPRAERNVFVDLRNGTGKPNPLMFHLKKKGIAVDLVTSQYGVASDFPIHIPHDGTPIRVDFLQRKIGDNGQLQITENKPEFKDWKQATNWWFRLEIPDGGFVQENDEFPFSAPEDGYQSTVEFIFQKDQPGWLEDISTNFYIKFGNPPRYGWLRLDTSIMMEGARFTYAINPTGSQNLEPK